MDALHGGAGAAAEVLEDAGAVVEVDAAGADEEEVAVGAVVDVVAAPVANGSQSRQLSPELPALGVGDLGGGGAGFGPGVCGMTTRFTRFTQRSSNPELAPWSLTW